MLRFDMLFWIALFNLGMVVTFALGLTWGLRKMVFIRDVDPELPAYPKVSLIVAARNEEARIEESLQSLLAQDYPNYELMVVNDRSTDRTGSILQAMHSRFPQLKTITLNDLPAGWIGKNYALHEGAKATSGELILFTDADIIMDKTAVRRGVAHLIRENRDHVCLLPDIEVKGFLLEVACTIFCVLFELSATPWKAKDPKSKAHMGVGAFNLLRRRVYDAVGGHPAIRMRPDDDLKLGKLVKQSGYAQEALIARDIVRVEWYTSFKEFFFGLEKNMIAGIDYHFGMVLVTIVLLGLFNVFPIFAVFLTTGGTQLAYALVLLVDIYFVWWVGKFHGGKRWFGVFWALGSFLFLITFLHSAYRLYVLGGIRWRGTFYSLKELKANKV